MMLRLSGGNQMQAWRIVMASHAVKPTPTKPSPEEPLPSLAEVLDRVASDGPQIITRGGERFVVLAAQEPKITPKRPSGPRFDGVDLERDKSPMRDVDRGDDG
jgi:hypothetical protein